MKVALYIFLLWCAHATVVVLNGGYLTVNGSVTDTYFDFTVDFQANIQWVAMIWSQNQADTDVTLLQKDSLNPASPVVKTDCYLDQNSYIQSDNVQNLMPSVTGLSGDISNGIKATFKREVTCTDTQLNQSLKNHFYNTKSQELPISNMIKEVFS